MSDMTEIRDPDSDSLLTPQNAVLALIDYQPEQFNGVASVGHDDLLAHVTMLGRVASTFKLPVVSSTVYVKHGMSGTSEELLEGLAVGQPSLETTGARSRKVAELESRGGRYEEPAGTANCSSDICFQMTVAVPPSPSSSK